MTRVHTRDCAECGGRTVRIDPRRIESPSFLRESSRRGYLCSDGKERCDVCRYNWRCRWIVSDLFEGNVAEATKAAKSLIREGTRAGLIKKAPDEKGPRR